MSVGCVIKCLFKVAQVAKKHINAALNFNLRFNTLWPKCLTPSVVKSSVCHLLHSISSSHCKPLPLLCPAHSPRKRCCCGREMDGCAELIYYSGLSVSEEGRQCRERDREREKAVVTNEGLSQWFNLPHASFIQRPAKVHIHERLSYTLLRVLALMMCVITMTRADPTDPQMTWYFKNHGNATFKTLVICPNKCSNAISHTVQKKSLLFNA